MFTIDRNFGGWKRAQAVHFADGALFDRIFRSGQTLTSAAALALAAPANASFAPARRLQRSVIPGFGLTLGFTVFYLSVIVLIPLSAIFIKTAVLGPSEFIEVALSRRALLAYRLSFGAAALAAAINTVFGLLVAWVLVRYDFAGRRIVSALADLPFALPTAVAGIALTALYAPNGWIGGLLAPAGIKVAFEPLGVIVALTFIGLPFVVRTIEPVLADLGHEVEEAAASLGAGRIQTFARVVLPAVLAALVPSSARMNSSSSRPARASTPRSTTSLTPARSSRSSACSPMAASSTSRRSPSPPVSSPARASRWCRRPCVRIQPEPARRCKNCTDATSSEDTVKCRPERAVLLPCC